MGYSLKISPIARANVEEAVSYYKQKTSLKIAQNFVKDYENTLRKIKQNPFYQTYYKSFRGLSLKKYPYIIFYQIDENSKCIRIKGVFQANQDTRKRPL